MARAKRSLGQNFLIDPNLQRKIVDELAAGADDVVLEVGPGHGELSRHLAGAVHRLVLVEKDGALGAELEARWGGDESIRIVVGDALEIDLSAFHEEGRDLRIISNVPYNITSPLIFAFLDIRPPPRRLVLTVQREVADRIVAGPGSRTYGALSVGVQAVAEARIAFGVGRRAFRPVPDVESAALVIDPAPDRMAAVDTGALRTVTRAMFGRRRKQIQKILRTAPELASRLDAASLPERIGALPTDRPEALSPEQFIAIASALVGEGES
ncbi:MAG: 16S rRNA (adenine(1518)-N(6)/adenine(1519)-N(6))-dimethyltransferase RsmA [Gemmatimonadota bacterium]|nr:16S rRNA (adenine(1518)-N(6)/adenine(1519)-N(6))-dimethyltransferase RsmA [Gemmatimonadota bacterium]